MENISYISFMKEIEYKGYKVLSNGCVYKKRGIGFIKPVLDTNGYYVARFQKKYLIHRFIWEAFNGPIQNKMTIDHIDGDKSNNSLYNLRMVSRNENTSLYQKRNRKLTNSNVLEAISLRDKGHTYKFLSELFGVDYKTIYRIINNKGYYGANRS